MSVSKPAFIIATDLRPGDTAWDAFTGQASELQQLAFRLTTLEVSVGFACLPTQTGSGPSQLTLRNVINRHVEDGATEIFVLPSAFEFNIWQRTLLGEEMIDTRRQLPLVSIHHDSVDPTYPLLVDCFTNLALDGIREMGMSPYQAGLLLVSCGQGDVGTRADTFRLMRILWEQTGVARAEVGFIRHPQSSLPDILKRCRRDPLDWVLIPQCQWDGELCDYAQVMLSDHQRAHPDSANWRLVDPPRGDPAILGWFEQRIRRLWQEKRAREASRIPSLKRQVPSAEAKIWSGQEWGPATDTALNGCIGRCTDSNAFREILERVLPKSDLYLVKVTWHGYAQGTYTGPAALDWLLGALPGRAIVLEGHTSGRNLSGVEWDWETDSQQHRAWIRQQDLEYMRRTGLADVIAKHKAQYFNVTEAWWDSECVPREEILAALGPTDLHYPQLTEFVPSTLMNLRGVPMVSFARFKGPTRLAISNLFGLIPHPLRTVWHGTSPRDFAAACCDMARIYGSLFPLFGLVEGYESAVRWDRKGLYRSRWGNYDLVLTNGLFTFSKGLIGADVLASRLQGQDVFRSGFFDVVRERLGSSPQAESTPLPQDVQASLA